MANANRFIQALRGKTAFLENRLDIDSGLLTLLEDSGVLSNRHVSSIRANGDRYAKVETLVNILRTCDDGKFDIFITELRNSSQNDVADTLVQNIVDQANLQLPHQVA